jgi:branched-chain amino acid aminotransferase
MTEPGPHNDLFVYQNGNFIPWSDARVHVFSPVVKYGAAVFEGIRGYWSDKRQRMLLFRLRDHLERMEISQRILRFDTVVSADEMEEAVVELVRRNRFKESVHIRPMAYLGGDGEASARGPVESVITAIRRGTPKIKETGCRAQISSWERLSDRVMPGRAKAVGNYNNSRLAGIQAKVDGYDTALLLNRAGKIAEGPSMCFFMIRNGVPITSSITSDILESITRDTVITLLEDEFGLKTEQREIDRSELFMAEEAFFCGTGWEVTPVINVDGAPIGNGEVGPIVKRLQQAYFETVTGIGDDPRGWLTSVETGK